MSKLILLWMVMLLGVVWLLFPYTPDPDSWIKFFPFSEQALPWQNYIFHMCEKFTFLVFAWVIFHEANDYRIALFVFFLIQCIRLIDYFLTYNEVWTYLGVFPVDTNTVGALFFTFAILYELFKQHGTTD